MSRDWIQGAGHSPVCQILLQIGVSAVSTSSPPVWTSSAGRLSTPSDFPFFNDCTAASTASGDHPLCLSARKRNRPAYFVTVVGFCSEGAVPLCTVRMLDHHPVLPSRLSQLSPSPHPLSRYFNFSCNITSNSIARVSEASGVIVVTFDRDTQLCTAVIVVVYCNTGRAQLAI